MEQARKNAAKIKDDGSWGVHGPKYAKTLVNEGKTFCEQALAILDKKTAAK